MVKIEGLDDLVKHLEYKAYEIKARSSEMVKYFTSKVIANNAINLTPYGELNPRTEGFYNAAERMKYLPPYPGTAKGGWQISVGQHADDVFGKPSLSPNGTDVKNNIAIDLHRYYVLGETIYVENLVPYMTQENWPSPGMGSIEGGYSQQAPNGIMEPMQQLIASSYTVNLQKGYKRAKVLKYKRG